MLQKTMASTYKILPKNSVVGSKCKCLGLRTKLSGNPVEQNPTSWEASFYQLPLGVLPIRHTRNTFLGRHPGVLLTIWSGRSSSQLHHSWLLTTPVRLEIKPQWRQQDLNDCKLLVQTNLRPPKQNFYSVYPLAAPRNSAYNEVQLSTWRGQIYC